MTYSNKPYTDRVLNSNNAIIVAKKVGTVVFYLLAALGFLTLFNLMPSGKLKGSTGIDVNSLMPRTKLQEVNGYTHIDDISVDSRDLQAPSLDQLPLESTMPSTNSTATNPTAEEEVVDVVESEDQSRNPGFVPQQRVIAGEKDVTSHAYEEATAHSMNPPPPLLEMTSDETFLADLSTRLVIAVALGVHSGHTDVVNRGLFSLPVFNTMLPSFLPTAQPHHIYRFYLAFDHDDPVYESQEWRGKIEEEFKRLVTEEDAKRPHRDSNYVAGTTLDATSLIVTLHWVHCDFRGKPSWAHSDAVVAAYKEGADYVFRTNDDTKFPAVLDWADRMVIDLRQREIPNLGVVGPACAAGANWILTHDFTHKTHVAVFGFQYPRSLPNWSSDDWITYVYSQFNLMHRKEDVPVEHMLHGMRYKESPQQERLVTLNRELDQGAKVINDWARQHYGKELPYTPKVVTCC